MSWTATTAFWNRKNTIAVGACAFFLVTFYVVSWSAWLGKCATCDEPLHLMGAWVQTHYDDFRCNPEDPPLWKYFAVAGMGDDQVVVRRGEYWDGMLSDIPGPAYRFAREAFYQTPENNPDKILRAARARMLLLGVVLGAGIAWWAWRLAGPLAAVVATAAFSFDPNFLAHSLLVKNDVAITLILLFLMAAIWLVGERATLVRCISVLLLVGIALTTKFSGILAFPMLAIALLLRVMIAKPWPIMRWTVSSRLGRAGLAAAILFASIVVGYVSIWACYGFRFGPTANPAEQFDLMSRASALVKLTAANEMMVKENPVPTRFTASQTERWISQWHPSATVRIIKAWNRLRILPQPWLYGFLYTYATSLARREFLCGEIRADGWWYYFPLAMIFKTPVATLVGFALAALVWIGAVRRRVFQPDWWAVSAAAVAPVFYMIVAMHSNLNIGLRHIFPVYPFLFIFIGVMAARAARSRPRLTRAALGLLFAGLLVETFCAYPNFIPFFNVAVGGPRAGLGLLSDSNIDWGQDVPLIVQWQQEHSDRQLFLSQFAGADPRYYGLKYIEMPGVLFGQNDQMVPSGQPEVYAISAVSLQGTYVLQDDEQRLYSRFREEQPSGVLGGGSMYLFNEPTH
jgi:4-amino-4-deoxy-L-arabinose transferase-like glycosyltransferase